MRAIPQLSILLSALAVLLAGCDRSPSEPPEVFDPAGSVSFTFRGARAGSYLAAGEMQLQGGGLPQLVTGATAYRRNGLLNVFAFRGGDTNRGDYFALLLGEVGAPGTFPLDPLSCQQQTLAGCRVGFFIPDLDPAQFDGSLDPAAVAERTYALVLGSVTVTAHTPMRVRGTFQGVAFRANEQTLQNMLTISDGRFDLPVRPQQP